MNPKGSVGILSIRFIVPLSFARGVIPFRFAPGIVRLANLTTLRLSHWSFIYGWLKFVGVMIPCRFAPGIIRLTLQISSRLVGTHFQQVSLKKAESKFGLLVN